MDRNRWLHRGAAVCVGLALAVMMMAATVAQAAGNTTCSDCQAKWTWWGVNKNVSAGGCKDFVSTSQSNNKGNCINKLVETNCKEICLLKPAPSNDVTCAGEAGIAAGCAKSVGQGALPASGPCNQDSWTRYCGGTSASDKQCRDVNVVQPKFTASPCNVNCDCITPP